MKRAVVIKVLFFIILAIGYYSCDIASNVEPVFQQYFIKYYGEDGDQEGNDFVINPDGTMFLLGTSTLGQSKRMYLVKVDAEGNEINKKTFGSNSNEFPRDIEAITAGPEAGNFIILSNVENDAIVNNVQGLDIRLTIINAAGDSLKSARFSHLESQEGKSITPLTDGGYLVAGKTTDTDSESNASLPSPGDDQEDWLIIRFQSDLSYLASDVNRVGGSYFGSAIKVFQQGNALLYAGYSDEVTGNESNYEKNFIFRSFNVIPNSLSTVYTGTSSRDEEMTAIARSPSGTFMAIGTQTTINGTDKQMFLTSVTANFSTVLKEGIMSGLSGQTEGVSVAPSGAGNFLVLANALNTVGNSDIYISKINSFFEKDFELTFGSPGNDDTGSAVAELPNGDIVVLGTMHLTSQKKVALIKLRPNGQF
jgi:hypothetical protein